MSTTMPMLRPLSCCKSIVLRPHRHSMPFTRLLTTYHRSIPASMIPYPPPPVDPSAKHVNREIKTFNPPKSSAAQFKEPIKDLHAEQIAALDPTGARTALFSKTNPEAAKVGDILLVRTKTGEPFAGVCINIRRRGVETGILLRNELTRVAVEMWYKIYSPNVEGIELVQRKERRARRARLTYMRKPKHDMRSVQGVVYQYERRKAAARSGITDTSGFNTGKNKKKGKGKGKGKRK